MSRLKRVVMPTEPQSIGAMTIDFTTNTVTIDGKRVPLTESEYQVLELLVLYEGLYLSKGDFMDYLYSYRDPPEEKIIDVFICYLRKKIAAANNGEHYIETIFGKGRRLVAPVREAAAA